MLQEELDGRLERRLLCSLDLGFRQVPTDSETVYTAWEVLPLVQCRRLGTSAEDGICLSLSLGREHLVRLARVNEEGNARLFERLSRQGGHDENHGGWYDAHDGMTDLEVFGNFKERGVCDGSYLDDLVECEIKGVAT